MVFPNHGEAIEDIDDESPLARLQREAELSSDIVMAADTAKITAARCKAWSKSEGGIARSRPELTDSDFHYLFPSIPLTNVGAKQSPGINRYRAHQLRRAHSTAANGRTRPHSGPESNVLGHFSKLPGELRNDIYRLVVTSPEARLVQGHDLACGAGACVHTRLATAVPGLASACRQIRHEVLPIYCAENVFQCDPAAVRNRCVANWIRSMGEYSDLIAKVTLEVVVQKRGLRNIHRGDDKCEVTIECPVSRADGQFAVMYDGRIPKRHIAHCELSGLVARLNENLGQSEGCGRGKMLADLMASDELADLVYWCKK